MNSHKFRHNIPLYEPPDRKQWAKEHAPPVNLGPVRNVYIKRALASHNRDEAALTSDEAIKAHGDLDDVCDHVHSDLKLPESTVVFFDPTSREFWAYPEK